MNVAAHCEDPLFHSVSRRAAEWSGFYGAKDGQLAIQADLATNDTPGLWRISVRELASGRQRDAYMRVAR